MEDLMEQANEIQEVMSRSYGVPYEFDEDDLEAGDQENTFFFKKIYKKLT